jgi:hypothetical protein
MIAPRINGFPWLVKSVLTREVRSRFTGLLQWPAFFL